MKLGIDKIKTNPVALRGVMRESADFICMKDSISLVGLMNPIAVRLDATDGVYEIVDGLQRYTCCMELGWSEIEVNVVDYNETEAMYAQIIANAHRVEMTPVQYTKALYRVITGNPTMTQAELAAKVAKTPAWIAQHFDLLKLNPKVQELVDAGNISLANAYALAKIKDHDEQMNYLAQAQTQPAAEFIPMITERVKEINKAIRQGRTAEEAKFVPIAHLQKPVVVKEMAKDPSKIVNLARTLGKSSIEEVVSLTLDWCLHLDPESVEIAKAKYDAQRQAVADKKAAAKAEREAKKAGEVNV